jgi:SNF2 family DNA or RNA helicase
MKRKLRSHQQKGLAWALKVQHPALFWKMRLGKTLVVIRAVKVYHQCKLILVVAPFAPLGGWMEELELEGEKFMLISGTKAQRIKKLDIALNSSTRIWCLINKEGHRVLPEIANKAWDVVVLDESHFIKNPPASKMKRKIKKAATGTQITRFFIDNFRNVKHRWLLTGTPAPESPMDYFCQLLFLNPTLLSTRNFWHFRMKYFEAKGYDWKITHEGKKYLTWMLSKCAHFLTRDDVKMGGVIVREKRLIELPPVVRKIYKTLEKEFLLETAGKTLLKTMHAGQKYQWLKSLCSGFYNDQYCFSHKVDELFSLLSGELKGEQTVIWCQRIQEVELIQELMDEHRYLSRAIWGKVKPVNREIYRREFQSNKVQHLVVQPETMKEGTKLTAAGALIYFNSPEASVTREQTESRHVDVAVQDNSLVIDIACINTVEEDILEAQAWKESESEMLARIQRGIRRRNEK